VQILRILTYFIPIVVIIACYGIIVVVTSESDPFTIVTGISMQPTILPGTIALISNVPFDQLKQGDVIVFEPQVATEQPCESSPGTSLMTDVAVPCYVIHRIVKIQTENNGERIVTTKGDNNPGPITDIDTNVTRSRYIGEVVLQFPLLGYLTEQPYNEIIAAVIFTLLIAEIIFERRGNFNK